MIDRRLSLIVITSPRPVPMLSIQSYVLSWNISSASLDKTSLGLLCPKPASLNILMTYGNRFEESSCCRGCARDLPYLAVLEVIADAICLELRRQCTNVCLGDGEHDTIDLSIG
jgi:hypothetical protein